MVGKDLLLDLRGEANGVAGGAVSGTLVLKEESTSPEGDPGVFARDGVVLDFDRIVRPSADSGLHTAQRDGPTLVAEADEQTGRDLTE